LEVSIVKMKIRMRKFDVDLTMNKLTQ